MSDLIFREWNSRQIRQREDGYLSATDMCQACGKQFSEWKRLKATIEYLNALGSFTGIHKEKLIYSIQGGIPQKQGTWVHYKVAVYLAQWLSVEFSIQVSLWAAENINISLCNFVSNTRNSEGFVYLVKTFTTNYYKIGISKDVYKRMQSLQTGTPFELIVCDRLFSMDCLRLEKALHEYYSAYSIRGEWFEFSPDMEKEFYSVASELDRNNELDSLSLIANNEKLVHQDPTNSVI